ncbi:MAG: polyprenyl synthetase family protein [Spirochaetales bacterium]|nr:polyprenyl synthetase family protein [Spirochaetales bacterium]
MIPYLLKQKTKIKSFLTQYINSAYPHFSLFGNEILDIPKRLINFTCSGKMIRGGLIALTYSLYTPPLSDNSADEAMESEIIKAGAVLELLQSGLLVHDDIMDRDEKRRGEDSIFIHYANRMKEIDEANAYHTGEAMGICTGDIFLFLAFQLISELHLKSEIKQTLLSLYGREMCSVATAQMYDVFWGTGKEMIPASDILTLYKYKTGRYTFSLPLKTGALIAGAARKEGEALEQIGELLGVIFQIKDDDINLYGTENETGKPVGSDIKEGKKTLYLSLIYEKANNKEKERLRLLIGNSHITEKDISYIKTLIADYDIRSRIKSIVDDLNSKAIAILNTMNPVNKNALEIFTQLMEFNKNRNK